MENRYLIRLSYNGSNYHGWQSQKNSTSVQDAITKALNLLLKSEIKITGAGRTDTGVHAKDYYAHFDFENKLPDDLVYKINKLLPDDIAIKNIKKVENDFHARFTAISRTYQYQILRNKNPFHKNYAYYFYGNIDINLMNEAAKILFEYTDFTSFSKVDTQTKTNNCKILVAEWTQEKDMLIFTIKADRFLRNMVRAIVGTLMEVGLHKVNLIEFRNIIESKNRSNAGYSVPANGLFLIEIEYP